MAKMESVSSATRRKTPLLPRVECSSSVSVRPSAKPACEPHERVAAVAERAARSGSRSERKAR